MAWMYWYAGRSLPASTMVAPASSAGSGAPRVVSGDTKGKSRSPKCCDASLGSSEGRMSTPIMSTPLPSSPSVRSARASTSYT